MADISLRDRNGNKVEYPGIERIQLNTVEGETAEFVDATTIPQVLEDVPITLDFSGGNQTILAADGTVVKSAIIEKPTNLVPQYIAEGVDIAGIIGTLAAGGGGGNVQIASGTFVGASINTVQHGMGVVPDLVVAYPASVSTYAAYKTYLFVGVSAVFASALALTKGGGFCGATDKNLKFFLNTSTWESSGIAVFNATDTKIQFSGTDSACTYNWIALAGLT